MSNSLVSTYIYAAKAEVIYKMNFFVTLIFTITCRLAVNHIQTRMHLVFAFKIIINMFAFFPVLFVFLTQTTLH